MSKDPRLVFLNPPPLRQPEPLTDKLRRARNPVCATLVAFAVGCMTVLLERAGTIENAHVLLNRGDLTTISMLLAFALALVFWFLVPVIDRLTLIRQRRLMARRGYTKVKWINDKLMYVRGNSTPDIGLSFLPRSVQERIQEKCRLGIYIYDDQGRYIAGPPVDSEEARILSSEKWGAIEEQLRTKVNATRRREEDEE